MALSLEVKTYIETYEAPIKKELSYIIDNNWVEEDTLEKRAKMYDRQHLMTSRNMDKLIHFCKIAENEKGYKTVKNFISVLVEMMEIIFKREQQCADFYDWSNYAEMFQTLEPEDVDKLVDEEISFQSEIRDEVSKLNIKLKKLNLDGENNTLELPIRADVPLPFLLRRRLEIMFPEIIRFKNERKEKEERRD